MNKKLYSNTVDSEISSNVYYYVISLHILPDKGENKTYRKSMASGSTFSPDIIIAKVIAGSSLSIIFLVASGVIDEVSIPVPPMVSTISSPRLSAQFLRVFCKIQLQFQRTLVL